jgi:hypothetical protein
VIDLNDDDILSRLTNFEDAFVERKSTGDTRDLLKTAVAFANSTPIGYPAILFYGVTDKGVPEGKANLDSLQKTISEKLSEAYPPIYYLTKVLQQEGKQFLGVIVPGSENRPHFAGPSYIRVGTQSKETSEEQFERLIAERISKAREILKWRGRDITLGRLIEAHYPGGREVVLGRRTVHTVIDCNQFYVTLQETGPLEHAPESYPLAELEISFDNEAHQLQLHLKYR